MANDKIKLSWYKVEIRDTRPNLLNENADVNQESTLIAKHAMTQLWIRLYAMMILSYSQDLDHRDTVERYYYGEK